MAGPFSFGPSDRSHDLLRTVPRGLDAFFRPRRIAVVGASGRAGSVGKSVFENLLRNPAGIPVIPVNSKRTDVLGIPAIPDITQIPDPVDLAIIATPASTVPRVIGHCAQAGIPAAVILSAGFREIGAAGEKLEREALEQAGGKVRLIGPNCMGIMNPALGLNATFADQTARPGNLAFLSQSGAMGSAILDWSFKAHIGFSGFVSAGSMIDVGFGDLIDYYGDDPDTHAILLYMETVGDARAFLSAAREVALSKPIIVIKGGRTRESARAVSSHTGVLAGSDAVLDAAFHRAGVQRVDSVEDLFYLAEALAQQPRPKGFALTMVTNAGGPGVMAVDALIDSGGRLAPLSAETLRALDGLLPAHWSRNNPIDVIGDADPDRFGAAVRIALDDPGSDGVLAILTRQAMTDPAAMALKLIEIGKRPDKPLLASWMGGAGVEAGTELLNRAGIPVFPFPEIGVRVFSYMAAHQGALRDLYEIPRGSGDEAENAAGRRSAAEVLDGPWQSGRAVLTESESKRFLQACGIPMAEATVARTEEEALRAADHWGYPVAVKLHSETLTHKTDVGGVRLDVRDAREVGGAFRAIRASVGEKAGADHFHGVSVQRMIRERGIELILGGMVDAQFGPVVLFGWGGTHVEALGDTRLALPPLNTHLARQLMRRTRVHRVLEGARGEAPVDFTALEQTVARFSRIMTDHPRVKEIDVNPFLVSSRMQVALDARVILHDRGVPLEDLPRPAIRPYPGQYAEVITLKDGRTIRVRPIRPEDEPLVARFHGRLSEQTVYQRYFESLRLDWRTAHARLSRICFNDYDRTLGLVAEVGAGEIAAMALLTKTPSGRSAELSMLVQDGFQGLGLGREMVRILLRFAADEGLEKVTAQMLGGNVGMRKLCPRQALRFVPGKWIGK